MLRCWTYIYYETTNYSRRHRNNKYNMCILLHTKVHCFKNSDWHCMTVVMSAAKLVLVPIANTPTRTSYWYAQENGTDIFSARLTTIQSESASRRNKYQLIETSGLRAQTKPTVFVPRVAKQHNESRLLSGFWWALPLVFVWMKLLRKWVFFLL